VNDLAGCLANIGTVVQFADDTTIVVEASTLSELLVKMTSALEELDRWFKPNMLSMNHEKTLAMIFSSKCLQIPRDTSVEIVGHARFLGVVMDQQLKWDHHVNTLRKKLASSYYVIKSLSRKCHPETVRKIYFAQFQAVMQYAVVFWGSANCTDSIFKLQKKTIRVLSRLGCRESCRPAFKQLRILTLCGLHILAVALFVWDHRNLFQTRSSIHEHYTRGAEKFDKPKHRLQRSNQDLLLRGAIVFNKFSVTLKSCASRNEFKRSIKDFLISNVFYSFDEFVN
jgi:hypothetical protein